MIYIIFHLPSLPTKHIEINDVILLDIKLWYELNELKRWNQGEAEKMRMESRKHDEKNRSYEKVGSEGQTQAQ